MEKNDLNNLYIKNTLTIKPINNNLKKGSAAADKAEAKLVDILGDDSIVKDFFTIRQFKKELGEALEIIKIRSDSHGDKSIYNVYLEAGIDAAFGFSKVSIYSGELVKISIVSIKDDLTLIIVLADYYDCATNFKEAEEELLEWQSYIHEPQDTSNRICYTTNGLKPQVVETTHDYIYNVELFGESLLRNYLLQSV